MLSEERLDMKKIHRKSISACRKTVFLHTTFPSFRGLITGVLAILMLASSCRQSTDRKTNQQAVAGKDLFVDKATIKHAHGFSIEYYGNYKLVKILNYVGEQADTLQYLLVQRGTDAPAGFNGVQRIEIPVKTMVAMSSLHIALADFAECTDVLVGLGSIKYVSSPNVLKNIAAGKIKEVGMEAGMNDELLISMQPDVVMVVGNPESSVGKFKTLTGAGVPILMNSEWLETTPLARAEWVKLMAALVNKEALVNKKFEQIEQEYRRLVVLAKTAANKPGVIVGTPFKGTWFVPDGDSYMAQFLRDAGTTYKWSDIKGKGSLPLDFESVAPVALNADYWINVGNLNSKAEVAAKDSRFTFFKSYKQGKVYNYNKKVNDIGSNDYWESGAVNPHLLLADLIKIFHPELLPAYQLEYYKQIQ
jgi:iron complex transport system substrate-binding protein